MKKTFVLGILIFFVGGILSSCGNKTNTPKNDAPKTKGMDSFVGNYVTADYSKKNEGADWVAVTISKLSDSVAHVRVRSRIDIKKPTCTFDMDATLKDSVSLLISTEGAEIVLQFADSVLTISSANDEGKSLMQYSCSGGGSLAGTYIRWKEELDQSQIDKADFRANLSMGDIFFELVDQAGELSIQPNGLKESNDKFSFKTNGTIIKAQIEDLDKDGSPEVLVYVSSNDNLKRGNILGVSVNDGKSISQISYRMVAENEELNKGYNGSDEFEIVEGVLCQRFPLADEAGKPTGKMRQIQYKLVKGEAMKKLEVGKVLEF